MSDIATDWSYSALTADRCGARWNGAECGDAATLVRGYVLCPACSNRLDELEQREPSDDYVGDMVTAYITAGLWATSETRPDEGEDATPRPLDDDYDESDLSPQARASIEADCLAFAQSNWDDLKDMDPQQAGHDFLLTRDGHGVGFWDRGLGERGDRLTQACEPWGGSELYVGDDEQVHTANQSTCADCGC